MGVRRIAPVLFVVVSAVLVGLHFKARVDLPPHLLGHPSVFARNFLSPETGDALLKLMKSMKELPSNAQDTKFYKTLHEHIGEARPMVNNSCSHPFLVPNLDRTLCILPGRIDIGRHFILAGGVEGMKEAYEVSLSRLLSFGRYMFDLNEFPLVKNLFTEKKFLDLARAVCPPNKPVLDPFQFNFIVQIPGQSVALHLDAPYIWGATRFEFPQWLIVAMVYSGLWQDKFVDQVQVVGYFHKWHDVNGTRDGSFVYWDENVPMYKTVPPEPLAASGVDGSKVVHAASIYYKDRRPPHLDKNKEHALRFVKDDKWELTTAGKKVADYTDDDIRMTIVYRARCFESEERKKKFNNLPKDEILKLEDILETFRKDMVKRGVRKADEPIGDALDFAIQIMDTYIKYPLPPKAIIPYNYCALSRIFPQAETVLKHICT